MSKISFPVLREVTDVVPLHIFLKILNEKILSNIFEKEKIKLSHILPSPNIMFFLICIPPVFVFMHTYFINLKLQFK